MTNRRIVDVCSCFVALSLFCSLLLPTAAAAAAAVHVPIAVDADEHDFDSSTTSSSRTTWEVDVDAGASQDDNEEAEASSLRGTSSTTTTTTTARTDRPSRFDMIYNYNYNYNYNAPERDLRKKDEEEEGMNYTESATVFHSTPYTPPYTNATLPGKIDTQHVASILADSAMGPFRLRMVWNNESCWQGDCDYELDWCMQCEGYECNEGDILWIELCRNIDQQLFIWLPVADEAGVVLDEDDEPENAPFDDDKKKKKRLLQSNLLDHLQTNILPTTPTSTTTNSRVTDDDNTTAPTSTPTNDTDPVGLNISTIAPTGEDTTDGEDEEDHAALHLPVVIDKDVQLLTSSPSEGPSLPPTTKGPTPIPTTSSPTEAMSLPPSSKPTIVESHLPSFSPSDTLSHQPSTSPSDTPTEDMSLWEVEAQALSSLPSTSPTDIPTIEPTKDPTTPLPTPTPSYAPTSAPSPKPTKRPTTPKPTTTPSYAPSTSAPPSLEMAPVDQDTAPDFENQPPPPQSNSPTNGPTTVLSTKQLGQFKVADLSKNLCLDRTQLNRYHLKACDQTTSQFFYGFPKSKRHTHHAFEVRPREKYEIDRLDEKCLNMHHHPRNYEEIINTSCELARHYHTSRWHMVLDQDNDFKHNRDKNINTYLNGMDDTPLTLTGDPNLYTLLEPRQNPRCGPYSQCGVCQGHCTTDEDCVSNLKCFERTWGNERETPPGCHGPGIPRIDYCYAEAGN